MRVWKSTSKEEQEIEMDGYRGNFLCLRNRRLKKSSPSQTPNDITLGCTKTVLSHNADDHPNIIHSQK